MKLTFFNHYGVGDLFESREFVLDWMRLAGVTTADYAHRALPGFFEDLPQLNSVEMRAEMDMRASVVRLTGKRCRCGYPVKIEGFTSVSCTAGHMSSQDELVEVDELLVNTWIGRDGQYVVNPGVGCTVEGLYRMHNAMLREAGLPLLPRTMVEYIPSVDYARVDLGNIHEYLDDDFRGKRVVLVCNGKTGSGQAENFDFGEMVDRIAERDDTKFIFTEKTDAAWASYGQRNDIWFTDDLTDRSKRGQGAYGPCDFNAIGYFSRFCEVIVGRCSGAQMAANCLPNWMDSTKTLLCFTHHRNGACFVLNPDALGLKMKVAWSPAANPVDAAAELGKVLI